ncbi:MAG: DNA-binding response regulator [Phenylobacterium zucineum]|nr:MAG: DNA-binding response regulator [Phenylobacterium zucineum]
MMDEALFTAAAPAHLAIIGENEADWDAERQLLEARGYACRWLPMAMAHRRDPERDALDLLILDGDADGSGRVLVQVKATGGTPPAVLVVAGSADEADVEAALSRGADDYLIRPVCGPVLLARIKAAMRGRRGPEQPAPRRIGPYEIDPTRRTVTLNGAPAALTAREFDLARLLADNIGRPLSRAYLLEALWGYRADLPTRTLDTHASRVRSKLGLNGTHGVRLTSLYGYGYQLDLCPA